MMTSGKRPSSCIVLSALTCAGLLFAAGCADEPESGPTNGLLSDLAPVSPETTANPAAKTKKTTAAPERPVASETGPWPTATATETTYKFGRMSVGTELDHTFTIENEGQADLELMPGKPTCKCTAFDVSPTTVKPGESAEVHIRWKGKFKDSTFQHGGPVYTNDPNREAVRFAVKGIVDASFDVLPEETWSAGEITGDVDATFQGFVMSRVHDDFSITEIKCESPHVKYEIIPLTEKKDLETHEALCAYRVDVSVAHTMPPGILEAKLTMQLDCEKAPVTVTVTANKVGPIRILPWPGVTWTQSTGTLHLGQFPSRQGREASLILLATEADSADPLQFTEIDAKPSYLKVDLERVGSVGKDKARYKMTIKIPPGVPRTDRKIDNPGLLNIKTNHASGQTLRIKVLYQTQS